ncbi:hypothetical protein COT20_01070 [bacterium (Candidatus Gribaldobacteria) CG08_land_8_20_14_0_20_39_15]|uniref:DUF5666 domain-containing protein n=1 Tax=bacterium (Candidatus Gribaldobacteria) CG08_land_8_20_14_0_20_39_15 TaxID=2014273 RepID=A0A2M6XUW6_9BACT|nr:MAG: hypothetical protein COT20_01070 [bacterium (Candidatus Gribaldobacteria) CG08_land_8_20_14_0_20_39_15]
MKRSNLTIIVIVISLLVGGVIGYGYGYGLGKKAITREAPPEVEVSKTALEEKAGELEKSKMVVNLCANLHGEVIEVSKDVLTLSKEGDLLKLEVGKDVRIYRQELPREPGEALVMEEIKFEEVKKRDQVSVYSRLTEEGELVVQNITVLTP